MLVNNNCARSALYPVIHSAENRAEALIRLKESTKRADLSPLRFPGGKRKLIPTIANILLASPHHIELFVEPFAGGASVAIALLESGLAKTIALTDLDPLIASFWKTVFSCNAIVLAEMLENTPVSLAERDRLINMTASSDIERAFQCIFFNRTSFSGILNKRAGVIGGRKQSGKYTIGCRFNTVRLATRIRRLSELSERVLFVRHESYADTITHIKLQIEQGEINEEGIAWYLDPPFFEKAERLYRHWFTSEDHATLHSSLQHIPGRFILSYDNVAASRKFYGEDPRASFTTATYSATSPGKKASELIITNTTPKFPSKQKHTPNFAQEHWQSEANIATPGAK